MSAESRPGNGAAPAETPAKKSSPTSVRPATADHGARNGAAWGACAPDAPDLSHGLTDPDDPDQRAEFARRWEVYEEHLARGGTRPYVPPYTAEDDEAFHAYDDPAAIALPASDEQRIPVILDRIAAHHADHWLAVQVTTTPDGVRTWNDGCLIEARPVEASSEPAVPVVRRVTTSTAASDTPADAEAPKRRRRWRTRPSLTVIRPYDY